MVKYEMPRISHEDIRDYIERKLAYQKRGIPTESEIKPVKSQRTDDVSVEELKE